MYAASPGVYVLRCSFSPCECTPIPIQEMFCKESDVTLLDDDMLDYFAGRGFSQCLKVEKKACKTLPEFFEAVKNVCFFPPALNEIKEKKPKKPAAAPKKMTVKEASKKNSAAKKKQVKKPVEEEVSESEEDPALPMEDSDDEAEDD